MEFTFDEAGMRELEPTCASRGSADSRRLVALFSSVPLSDRQALLHNAVVLNLPHLTRCLLDAKTPADTLSQERATPLLIMAAQHGYQRVIQALLDGGADACAVEKGSGYTALSLAAKENHPDCIPPLLAAGADANRADFLGNSPLMRAVINKHNDCARALLAATDTALVNHIGRTAFHIAVDVLNVEMVDLLLPLVADIDQRVLPGSLPGGEPTTSFGQTALHFVCLRGDQHLAKALLRHGASRTAQDSALVSPLHCAAQQGHVSVLIVLVGRPGSEKMTPAEVDLVDNDGLTALHYAALYGNEKVCGVLIQAGARLDARSRRGHPPLFYALAQHPHNAALLALLSGNGPSQLPGTVCDRCGKTAEQAGVEFLRTCGACFGMRYCGAACSAAAWPGHKAACREKSARREKATVPTFIQPPAAGGSQ